MKQILYVFLFLVLSSSLLANTLEFKSYYVAPTTLHVLSLYDFMNGGYNGFPMRIQGDHAGNQRGIYFTYMVGQSMEERLQYWAFSSLDGEIILSGALSGQIRHREGFGSIAIDPATGNPIFAWHTYNYNLPYEPVPDMTCNYFLWDNFFRDKQAGQNMSDYRLFVENRNRDPQLQHNFIWPVLHFGPSPFEGKNRIYAFLLNSLRSSQAEPTPSSYVPSSSILVTYADISLEDYDDINNVVWVEKTIEYLERMHTWNPAWIGHHPTARAFLTFAVAPEGDFTGHVALAGYVDTNSNDWSWTDLEPHNYVVLLNTDYGEGDFTPYGTWIENRKEPYFQFTFNPEEVAQIHDTITLKSMEDIIEKDFLDSIHWAMRPQLTKNTTMVFDKFGRIHFPAAYQVLYERESSSGYTTYHWLPLAHTINMLSFNTDTKKFRVGHIYPKPTVLMEDTIPFSFDLDNDGFIDINILPDMTLELLKINFPYFNHDDFNTNLFFYYGQMRMTHDNRATMALVWMDSAKAKEHDRDPELYKDFKDTPEIMISISIDTGASWSEPFRMNYLDFPELSINPIQNTPSFIYPADRLFRIDEKTVRLYFMYNDDYSYGVGDPFGQGHRNGTAIRFTAVDFDVSNVTNTINETKIKPLSMLSQNYPNPFNPFTTIKFDIPASGHVNLNVYNIRGQLVRELVNEILPAGNHSVLYSGVDVDNKAVASGVYLYKLEAEGRVEVKRMILLK